MRQRSQLSQPPASDTKKPIRCAIYTRKSTEEGLEQEFNSLDAQRESAEAFIASQKNEGWVCLPEKYDDGGFTGGNMERPALKRLLAQAEAGNINCIVVYKVDRLSRSLMDFARIMEILERQHISFVSVTQQFNTTHSMGRLTLNILLSFAQFEREIISERTRDKMSAARKKGMWMGGIPVLGYDIHPQNRKLVVNPEEALRVKEAFSLYLDHESLLATAQELNHRGWTTKQWTTKSGIAKGGLAFEKVNLFRLLTNLTYIGKLEYKGELYEGEHEAIVESDVWNRVQALLHRNGKSGGVEVRNKFGSLLRGILFCDSCHAAMVHTYTARKECKIYRYYVCSKAQHRGWHTCPTKSLPAGEIEQFVVNRIRSIGSDRGLITETLNQARQLVQSDITKLENELTVVQHQLEYLGAEVPKVLSSRNGSRRSVTQTDPSELEEKIRIARQRAEELSAEIALRKNDWITESDIETALGTFDPMWEAMNAKERTKLIHLLVERVGYEGSAGKLSITFRPSGIKSLGQESFAA